MSGLISMAPSSIAYSGTGATFDASTGTVTVTAVTSISLNGVFTLSYTNYCLWADMTAGSQVLVDYRFRASGSDATISEYNTQSVQYLGGAGPSGARAVGQTSADLGWFEADNSINYLDIYAPMIAQRPVARQTSYLGTTNQMVDFVTVLNSTSAYDGITIFTGGTTLTGKIHVWAYAE